jgi:hypothetical protein
MHPLVLTVHSLIRWFIILLGAVAAVRGIAGWLGGKPWFPGDDRAGALFVIGLDIQLLLGLLLYFVVSPVTTMAFGNMGTAMGNGAIRFFLVEHLILMVAGIALAHVGRALGRRATDSAAKHRRSAIFFTLALVLILLGTPWPGPAWGRPLIPGL